MGMHYAMTNTCKWIGARPAHTGTQLLTSFQASGGDAQTVYTCPGDKIAEVCNIIVSTYGETVGIWKIKVYNNSHVLKAIICEASKSTNIDNDVTVIPFNIPLELTGGWYIVFDISTYLSANICIHGFEE